MNYASTARTPRVRASLTRQVSREHFNPPDHPVGLDIVTTPNLINGPGYSCVR